MREYLKKCDFASWAYHALHSAQHSMHSLYNKYRFKNYPVRPSRPRVLGLTRQCRGRWQGAGSKQPSPPQRAVALVGIECLCGWCALWAGNVAKKGIAIARIFERLYKRIHSVNRSPAARSSSCQIVASALKLSTRA